MRSAEEILKSEYSKLIANPEKVYLQNPSIIKAAHTAINEARKEAIEECAERAKVFMPSHPHLHGSKNIDKQSILSLIKELK